MQRVGSAESERILVEEGHHHITHGVNGCATVLGGCDLLNLHLLDHGFGGKRSSSNIYGLNALLVGAERDDIQLIEVVVRANADRFQINLGLLNIIGQYLLFERHRGRRVLDRPIVDTDQLLNLCGHHGTR